MFQHLMNIHFHAPKLWELVRDRPAMLYFIFNPTVISVLVAHDLESGELVAQVCAPPACRAAHACVCLNTCTICVPQNLPGVVSCLLDISARSLRAPHCHPVCCPGGQDAESHDSRRAAIIAWLH